MAIRIEQGLLDDPVQGNLDWRSTSTYFQIVAKVNHLSEGREEVKLSNPLRLSTAISFAIAFAVVLILVRGANEYYGDAGVFAMSVLAGPVDVNAITLTASGLASSAQIDATVAAIAIILAALVNTAAKAVFAISLGSKELRKPVFIGFSIVLIAGILSSVVFFSVVL